MRLNKIIFYTSLETIGLILIIISTYILWDNFEISENAQIAYSYTHKSEKIVMDVENNLLPLIPLNDNDKRTIDNKIKINIKNVSKVKKRYILYLIVNENSTLDKKYIKLNIEGKISKLTELENFRNAGDVYYLIKTDIIDSQTEIENNLYLWLNENTPNLEQNKKIFFEFRLEEV